MGCGASSTSGGSSPPTSSGNNPKVYFDIDIGGSPSGRITMELRSDVVPKQLKTFELYVLMKRGLDIKDHLSTVLYHNSCVR